MEFKGTKGEWYVVGSEPAEIATDKTSICFLGRQDYFNIDIEQRANAKLIAAAPELLEALQKSQKYLVELGTPESAQMYYKGMKAINKALN